MRWPRTCSRPVLSVPHHPIRLAAFGPRALLPATAMARWFRTEQARALFGGAAAHVYTRLDRPLTASLGLMILASGHRYGWPVAARWLRLDQPGAGRRARRARRHRDHRGDGREPQGHPRRRHRHARPEPGRGAGDLRRRHARRGSSGPIGATARARRRSRSTSPSRVTSRGRTPTAPGRARSISAARSPRSPTPNANGRKARWCDGRSCSSGSSTWPTRPARPATSTRSGPTRTCRSATTATPPPPSSTRSSGSRRDSATASWRPSARAPPN